MNYNNAVLTITDISTPDPHVTFADGAYHLVRRMIVDSMDEDADGYL
jgi:hypothetical protein